MLYWSSKHIEKTYTLGSDFMHVRILFPYIQGTDRGREIDTETEKLRITMLLSKCLNPQDGLGWEHSPDFLHLCLHHCFQGSALAVRWNQEPKTRSEPRHSDTRDTGILSRNQTPPAAGVSMEQYSG